MPKKTGTKKPTRTRRKSVPKKSFRRRLIAWGFTALLLITVGLALYGVFLAQDIQHRFSGRRWTVPSRIYSDAALLYLGQSVNVEALRNRLKRLQYRPVNRPPREEGEMSFSGTTLRIFLHDIDIPGRARAGYPVQIQLQKGQIHSIKRLDTSAALKLLELEPEELMLFFGLEREDRQLVSIDEVPLHVIQAVLAAEDARYYDHPGMDIKGILRAVYMDLKHGELRQGGSTITQQLAKNYFLTPEKTFQRKLKEGLLAVTMEMMYDKDEILEIYLNEIYFGQKGSVAIHGIGEASWFYFGKPVKAISLHEAAALAGLIRAPNHYSPYKDPERCQERRNYVLQAMHKQGWISEGEAASASDAALETIGYQAYGRIAPYFLDFVVSQLKTLYSPDDLASLGLFIQTTLDTQVQEAAETALKKGLERVESQHPDLKRSSPEKQVQGAIVVMQPRTGSILAMVGGRHYGNSQFNRITHARRQPGSAFKPFVFLSALDRFTPASLLSNQPKTYTVDGQAWEPKNYAPLEADQVTLRTALAKSVNRASVDLAMQVGLSKVVATAQRFGFSTPLPPYPSLALGAAEVIPLELARAYCAFAGDGILPQPLSLREVIDEGGETLERRHMEISEVTSPAKAYLMTSLLQSVVQDGTARSLRSLGIPFPAAGKTGTTNDSRDVWFVGYTPDVLALVWVGFDEGGTLHGTGSSIALPIWADLLRSLPQFGTGNWFTPPEGVVTKRICPASGFLALPGACPSPQDEVFLLENAPSATCTLHAPKKKTGILEWFKDVFESL
ncbi:transglycosylase domain-containing protein [Desulfatiglans anilini]|uniref:transglycosylase domain-containing protein n=1 Tax=Desulfatiglans anilini TaxID=90728 RepID=UPI0004232F8A|nr:PBP1A family penicillin-binding protein [Desulfatiglans anilini]